jgi:glycosyltransferase involved in cell wall biosynthesis
MRILADIRSLQDPRDSCRGIRSHAACLLRAVRSGAGDVEIIGLTDPRLGQLAAADAALCDTTRGAFVNDDSSTPSVFLQLSPLTHDTLLPARLLDRCNVLPATVIHEFIFDDFPDATARRACAAALVWLAAYRVFFPISEPAAADLEQRLGISRRRMTLTGASSGDPVQDGAVGLRFSTALRQHFDAFVQRAGQRRRPTLAIASPFPPDRSGVADYTLRCVEALGRHADIDIYTEQPAPVPSESVRCTYPLSAAAWLRPDYDATIAVLGNSPFHRRIVDLHGRFGGPCIIHDGRLIDFYVWRDGIGGGRAVAARELRRVVTEAEVRGWLADPDTLPTPFLSGVLANAHPAIVHSRPLARLIASTPGVRVEPLPFCVYRQLADDQLAADARRAARHGLGVADDAVLIVSFGWVIPSKAPETVIDAMSILRRRGVPVHLRFVGHPGDSVERLTARAGGPEAVSFTRDWVDEDDYRRHLQAADYGIQLRTVRSGAISGGLMDCIAAGLPTVANADLADAVDAPAYVLRVADALDPDEIAARLAAAVAAAAHATRHDAARLSYATAHSFDAYATRLLAVLGLTGPRIA